MKISSKNFIKLYNYLYKFFRFFTGGSWESSKSLAARYFVYIIIVLLANILLGKNVGNMRYPWYANVSIFLLLNINIILVLVLFIVLFRNLAKLMTDRKRRIFGARLQTKLVVFSVLLVITPVFTIYLISTSLVRSSIDRWFDTNVQRSVRESEKLAKSYYKSEYDSIQKQVESLVPLVKQETSSYDPLEQLNIYMTGGFLNGIALYSGKGKVYSKQNVGGALFTFINDTVINDSELSSSMRGIHKVGQDYFFWASAPVIDEAGDIKGVFFILKKAPASIIASADEINELYELFKQLKFYSHPVRKAFNVSHFLAAVLVLFGCMWGSMIFVRSITDPLKSLAEAAGMISKGQFDISVPIQGNDEITYLSKSFNYMADNLNKGTIELRNKNKELNTALNQISRDKVYIDTIYKNVDSAIILFDLKLNILKMNDAAAVLLDAAPRHERMRGLKLLKDFLENDKSEDKFQTTIKLGEDARTYSVNVNKIYTNGRLTNLILVLDDNTNLVNLQKITLWKEIATRITHEIKNPLTPIRLTAERVKKRSREIENTTVRSLIDNSMVTIISEVDDMMHMVEEFNMFARMPALIKSDFNISELIIEVTALFRQDGESLIKLNLDESINIYADRNQFKRVLMNLIQNSYQALSGSGEIKIELFSLIDHIIIKVEDNGAGIAPEDLSNVFIPYFSKKPDGTGLGLAIVKKIIEEHNGIITAESQKGQYTRFTIKLNKNSR